LRSARASSRSIAPRADQSDALTASRRRRAKSISLDRLSMALLHALPAVAQGRHEPDDLIDDRGIHPKARLLQTMRGVLVKTREVLDRKSTRLNSSHVK